MQRCVLGQRVVGDAPLAGAQPPPVGGWVGGRAGGQNSSRGGAPRAAAAGQPAPAPLPLHSTRSCEQVLRTPCAGWRRQQHRPPLIKPSHHCTQLAVESALDPACCRSSAYSSLPSPQLMCSRPPGAQGTSATTADGSAAIADAGLARQRCVNQRSMGSLNCSAVGRAGQGVYLKRTGPAGGRNCCPYLQSL